MIKIAYNFTTKGPLHTGSDENSGTLRTLRRQTCILANPIVYESRLTEDERRNAVVHVALGIWCSIDRSKIKGTRAMGIYDEFANKLVAASRVGDKYRFLETLCRSWGIESIRNQNVLRAIDALSDQELLDTVRNESMYIMLKMRAVKEEARERKDEIGRIELDLPPIIPGDPKPIERTEDMLPCISGNSFRGRWRRMLMDDFCRRVGIEKLDKRAYHTLFTGGFLDRSTQYEDIDRMETFVKMCPALGALGSAIGNMTIEGEAKIGWAYPLCRERGTGEKSYWQYLDTVFQTRHDSSKTENDIELTGEDQTQQMKYEYEVFSDGTPFEHRVACTSRHELIISAFWHMLRLFDADPYIGGMGSVGNGEIIPGWELPEGGEGRYLEYLEANKDMIKDFWQNAKI